ncbi:MAG: hypothetical protein KJ630_21375 [Proteobacteria bacterium]|nr:hypothetical protein [Pseudomonadota bacterium]
MGFNILYVEDDDDDYKDILKHVTEYNEGAENRLPIQLDRAKDPEELESKLDIGHRIVLADIYYDNPTTNSSKNCLQDIKRIIREWSKINNSERTIPIIASSRRQTQLETLADHEGLFDIWDKNTSSSKYIVWRLSKLAQEMSRVQPDSYLQCLIRNMTSGPSWHDLVKKMAQKYNSGWTEYDQIDKAGTIIVEIAQKLNTSIQCKKMWNTMISWEALGRAISPYTRGHSRHAINVFWLGYYIINHNEMKGVFIRSWEKLLLNRGNMEDASNADATEAINSTWFYAGLFHDTCACVEKNQELEGFYNKLYGKFQNIGVRKTSNVEPFFNIEQEYVREFLKENAKSLSDEIVPIVIKSIEKRAPDHGFVGALYLIKEINEPAQKAYALEAGRALILHNIIRKFESSIKGKLSWDLDPFACLLALCDQLQTWDRERGDDNLANDSDLPVRAELLDLQITPPIHPANSLPWMHVSINYITRRHVEKSTVLSERVEDNLKKILQDNPYEALGKIKQPWPFKLESKFYLNRNYLTTLNF